MKCTLCQKEIEIDRVINLEQRGITAKYCRACAKKVQARDTRRARNNAMQSLGLTKVRGALGGTYWE